MFGFSNLDEEEDDYDAAAEEAMKLLMEDSGSNPMVASETTQSTSIWSFLQASTLLSALEIATKALGAEPKLWESTVPQASLEAENIYRESITVDPLQVESYYKLAILQLRFATNQVAIDSAMTLLRKAVDNVQRYRAVPIPWNTDPVCQRELDNGKYAEQRLALLLIHKNNPSSIKAAEELMKETGYIFRLSDDIFNYNALSESERNEVETDQDTTTTKQLALASKLGQFHDISNPAEQIFFKLVDQTLPSPLLTSMQTSFAPTSEFWKIHRYGQTGFFSYLYRLDNRPKTSIEQMIRHLYRVGCKHYPAVRNATIAEWWIHSRHHTYGHQMHFDCDDEGRGGIRHPQMGSVFYLTGEVGGPTLMTNQRLSSSTLANQGWLVEPKTNRYMMFDGRYLHGVIPGRGPNPKENSDPFAYRTTFMAAFWTDIRARDRVQGCHGSAMEFQPDLDAEWAKLFPLKEPDGEDDDESLLVTTITSESNPEDVRVVDSYKDPWGESMHEAVLPNPVPVIWQQCNTEKANQKEKITCYSKCFQGI